MAINVVLSILVLNLGYSVVHSAFPSEHETVSTETSIEGNIGVSEHSAKPDVAETAPMTCPVGFGCGYQFYNQTTLKTRRFVKYCTCPENSSCIKVGDNLIDHLYYYQCQNDQEDVRMPTYSSTTELPAVLDSGKLTSDMQDCTEDFMNRAYTTPTPESCTISPRSNENVRPSDSYSAIYRIYLFVPQNQEDDVESSDESNNGFTNPTYVTPDSVGGSSLDEIPEYDGDVAEVTYKNGADAITTVNVHDSEELSLDNPVFNAESTSVKLPLGKNEL